MQSKVTPYALTDGATVAVDWNNSQFQYVTFAGSRTFTFSNPVAGETYYIKIIQGGSGSYTATWPASVLWVSAAPTLSTGVADIDVIRFVYDGTNYFGESVGLNYV